MRIIADVTNHVALSPEGDETNCALSETGSQKSPFISRIMRPAIRPRNLVTPGSSTSWPPACLSVGARSMRLESQQEDQ